MKHETFKFFIVSQVKYESKILVSGQVLGLQQYLWSVATVLKRNIRAIRRLNIPESIVQTIESFYTNPQFRIKDSEGTSKYRKQQAGIRQGCPLSPYLFVLEMAVMFQDIDDKLQNNNIRDPSEGIEYNKILYADDTLIFGNIGAAGRPNWGGSY